MFNIFPFTPTITEVILKTFKEISIIGKSIFRTFRKNNCLFVFVGGGGGVVVVVVVAVVVLQFFLNVCQINLIKYVNYCTRRP